MKRDPKAMTQDQWRRWHAVRLIGLRRFVLTRGLGMAVAFYLGFVVLFGWAVRLVFRDDVDWRALMIIAAPGATAFGLIMSVWIWREQEKDYHHTPRPALEREPVQ